MENRPIVAITMGDPVGIGPEIAIKALGENEIYDICRPLIVGDAHVLEAETKRHTPHSHIHTVDSPENAWFRPGTIDVVSLSSLDITHMTPGIPTQETGVAMVRYIQRGITWAMEKKIDGLATGPINKLAMHEAGFHMDGHTEILAARTDPDDYVMMLAGSRLRVALVTIHKALCRIPEILTIEAIVNTMMVTEKGLRDLFGIRRPKLAVAGLNPHAGEGGLFGDEEKTIIGPAIDQAQGNGIDVSGPYPPDTVFYWALQGTWDAVIAMYHDQGLIPFKVVHFKDGVNTTLGLPIIRTSVDHGTAYDIAGNGNADASSMTAAIEMAALQANNRRKIIENP